MECRSIQKIGHVSGCFFCEKCKAIGLPKALIFDHKLFCPKCAFLQSMGCVKEFESAVDIIDCDFI